MWNSRFTPFESVFGRRHSRQSGIKDARVSSASCDAGAVAPSSIAQDATPEPKGERQHLGLPQGERTYSMFVQTAHSGTWESKPGDEGVYTLTLTGLPAQTVYFSDRPERIVGLQTTAEFLDMLGFVDDNPPNAALVTKAEDGGNDILVIELYDPRYSEGSGVQGSTLVYDARILENYHETNMGRLALEQDDTAIPSSFDGASLFIDDCPDGTAICYKRDGISNWPQGKVKFGCCYSFPSCHQCHDLGDICLSVPNCEDGGCTVQVGPCTLF
jgi:hypothetical protein